ncbi:translation elongation factor 4 [Hippea maritima]|uniref:Elongation factor 4 n=1 Tax=Hippea maritima (strain ATCC 700847 / DSM 10411 / MH2) TaxID=760142 RepID=F2LVW4_HIPMA|nr:translation elongation factor 4 [Hippea maritima]AEA33898.1 GTP-binding protein lepA [Hippea maritima DSM 10411]
MDKQKLIRNFSIIAHIDHGKSTLADRLIEFTGALDKREMKEQILDNLEVERKHGITVKAQTARLEYEKDGQKYILNMIDTPGHVDFGYEVSKSLKACEGCLLVVDATQGVEAQTIANAYLAIDNDLELIPVINKIDLPSADIEKTKSEIEDALGIDAKESIEISAKSGLNIDKVVDAIIDRIPPPKGENNAPLRALVVDSWYDNYRGVVFIVRVFDGELKVGDKILVYSTKKEYDVEELGFFTPKSKKTDKLSTGEVGYVIANIKNIQDATVGDTITLAKNPTDRPFEGFQKPKPFVFAGLYPLNPEDYDDLAEALEKLQLNDASLTVEKEKSESLGFGFRCGFLGVLSMNITRERLEGEFGLDVVMTTPSVLYKVELTNGETIEISNPSELPQPTKIKAIYEPMVETEIITPAEFVGNIIKLLQDKRGQQKEILYIATDRVLIKYKVPLAEILVDFYDKLKSLSRGYASFDYEFSGFEASDLTKLIILINSKEIDSFSLIVPKEKAYRIAREVLKNLKQYIPKQLFEVRLQAKVGGKIIAKETIGALRKDVLAKCYGGDITRKKKLLEKQKEGKKKLKQLGNVGISKEAFIKLVEIKGD